MSGLAGLYCYFLLLADAWLEDGAISAWLIPSEFMDVNYGAALRKYLTSNVRLLRIHRFCPTDGQFADAMVSSAVVIFKKAPPAESTTFSFGGSVAQPQHEASVPIETLRQSSKWTKFNTPGHVIGAAKRDEPLFGEFFSIKRGLATGDNGFFIVTEEQKKELDLPSQFLKPILPSPRHLKVDVIESDRNGNPKNVPRYFLIDCPLLPSEVKSEYPSLWAYLQQGMAKAVEKGYLTSRRIPWYSQENRPAAPFLCTYMGRSRNGKKPFRFIWNRSNATAHNVFLLLYPKGELKEQLTQKPELGERVFEALNTIDTNDFIGEGRVYGGGLFKMEPKELAAVPAGFVMDAVGLKRTQKQILLDMVLDS